MSKTNIYGDSFQPMLYPNQAVGFEVINRPYMASTKLDGIRCIFRSGEMLSRSFKAFESTALNERFESMKRLSKETGIIFDGEIYSPELTFQELMHYCRTNDLDAEGETLPESVEFYCFDAVDNNEPDLTAQERYQRYDGLLAQLNVPYVHVLNQVAVSTPEEARTMFKDALDGGYEGLILKSPDSKYKFGRITVKSGCGYKFKPYRTYDAQIIGVEQSTQVDPNAEKKINELGYQKTSMKKGDRVLIEKASAFWVKYGDKELKVTLAMTDEQKEAVWNQYKRDPKAFEGKWIEYKGMDVGAKDVPRHPVFIRFREDKD